MIIVVVVLLAILLFVSGFYLGAAKGERDAYRKRLKDLNR